jgi:hypothetical protein
MLDVSVSFNRYRFLGHEFLTWLWFLMEKDSSRLKDMIPDMDLIRIGNQIRLENNRSRAPETITIQGDEAGLEEGILALRKGAVVTEINIACEMGAHLWQFTLKGESLNLSNIKTPPTGPIEEKSDFEGKILEKIHLFSQIVQLVDKLYQNFLKVRLSPEWSQKLVPEINGWIHS